MLEKSVEEKCWINMSDKSAGGLWLGVGKGLDGCQLPDVHVTAPLEVDGSGLHKAHAFQTDAKLINHRRPTDVVSRAATVAMKKEKLMLRCFPRTCRNFYSMACLFGAAHRQDKKWIRTRGTGFNFESAMFRRRLSCLSASPLDRFVHVPLPAYVLLPQRENLCFFLPASEKVGGGADEVHAFQVVHPRSEAYLDISGWQPWANN